MQHKSSLKPQQIPPFTSMSSCIVCKGSHGFGNAVSLRKRPQRIEPGLWLRQSSVSLVCVINTCPDMAKVPVKVGKMIATALKISNITVLQGFYQLNPQRTTTTILRSRTQVVVVHLPVNSNQAKQPRCLL